MAHDLSKWVEEGSFQQRDYELEGLIKFSFLPQPIFLLLTGNCGGALNDRSIYFWNQHMASDEEPPIRQLAPRQVGPTGAQRLGALGISEQPDCQNPGPQYQSQFLQMEWYGQNGLIQLKLKNPLVDFLRGEESCFAPKSLAGGEVPAESILLPLLPRIEPEGPDRRRFAINVMEEIEMLDEAFEEPGGFDQPLGERLETPYQAPVPIEELNDEALEIELKVLLAKLARLGACVDLCSHCRTRDIYRHLVEEILPTPSLCVGIVPFHGLDHFPIYPFCSECQEEDAELLQELPDVQVH